jgi:dipeptidyl-peptidase-4
MRLPICFFFLFLISNAGAQQLSIPQELFSRAEKTDYAETSLSSDVEKFCVTIGKLSPYAYAESIGKTKEGRELMIVILANPKISSPGEAAASGKPVIYIQANIHAGEVEGKEASMQLMRELCFGPKTPLLENQILIFCPNFNPDGNDKLSTTSRPSQDGSPKMTGVRASGEGYDLNREGMKLEAMESKALMKNIIMKWDPCLFVDLHTDNGSWHGYTLNYAPAFLSAGMAETTSYVSDSIFPAVTKSVLERSGIPIFFHGYMNMRQGEQTTYSTYSHLPRYLVNYMGLRNRMAILSETFSHDSFEKRVLSNYLFLVSLLEYTSAHSGDLINVVKTADVNTVKLITDEGGRMKKGVAYEIAAAGKPIDLLIRETVEFKDQSGRLRRKPTGRLIWTDSVKHFNHFEPKISATVPFGYIFPASLKQVAEKLQEHGIEVKTIKKKTKIEAEQFLITKYTRAPKPSYGNHNTVTVEGTFINKTAFADAGSYYVDMRQPLAWLIFYMLEPQSDDGLLFWNYFDDYLVPKGAEKGNLPYPVLKLLKPLE